jgi:hypothetical protein
MAVFTEGGFLIERYSRSGLIRRRAQIVPARPRETKYDCMVTTEDGRRFMTGWLYPPGVRQGRAVAWLVD